MEFDVYLVISALSALVLISYIFNLIAAKTRIPTVLMLLAVGIGLREVLTATDRYIEVPLDFIQLFGVLGLILILLDAGLDLNFARKKLPLIRQATTTALFVLTASVVLIAIIIRFTFDTGWHTAFVFAAPLAVISSTIVAASIDYLEEDKREFLTYESALSDIFGILLFNLLIAGQGFSFGIVALNVGSILLAIGLSVVVTFGLIFLLTRVQVNIKAFLIHPTLILVYALGHMWNIPTLLTVLIFGLIVNNWRQLRVPRIHRIFGVKEVEVATETIRTVTIETAFLVRTIFFTLFGYMIDIRVLSDTRTLTVGGAITVAIFAVRWVYLQVFMRERILPELFFAPRGLVTIVLFYSIPASFVTEGLDDGVVLVVVLLTTVVMTIGSVWLTPHHATREVEENGDPEPEELADQTAVEPAKTVDENDGDGS